MYGFTSIYTGQLSWLGFMPNESCLGLLSSNEDRISCGTSSREAFRWKGQIVRRHNWLRQLTWSVASATTLLRSRSTELAATGDRHW